MMKRIYTPGKKRSVLFVDDDQLFIEAQRENLERHGFRVLTANSLKSAAQKLAEEAVVLVLVDVCAPGMGGVEILQGLRAQTEVALPPMVAFVNPYLNNLARAAQEAGASKCLTKAARSPGQLFESVRELLGLTSRDDSAGDELDSDAALELAASLRGSESQFLSGLRTSQQIFARTEHEESRRAELREMHRRVRSLSIAGMAGLQKLSQMADAFEALLIELHAKPKKITPSVNRTVAQAIDSLAALFAQAGRAQSEFANTPRILVVDDEIISRETICSALERAKMTARSFDDSLAALQTLEQEQFDLIFLDVEMPGLTGFELCVKIRETTANASTPVVFVTAHSDFGSRAQSALSGGNDFITKPFLAGELAVKALACLFKEKPRAVVSAPAARAPNAMEELGLVAASTR
ncbi:MAG: response regulator [Verrucomicrobiota bacterium]|nr:response regulator [Verrucomicrobiota bacterium]